MNEKISALLARRKMWANLYPAWYIKKHFALYEGELDALLEMAGKSAESCPADCERTHPFLPCAENVRYPSYITPRYGKAWPYPKVEDWVVWLDEAQDIPPVLFGGAAAQSGRIQSSKPNFTEQDKRAGLDKLRCICSASGNTALSHSPTCRHYNWSCLHPKTNEHVHSFRASGNGYDVCMDCGMSDVYYNWAYPTKMSIRAKDSSGNSIDGYSTRNDF